MSGFVGADTGQLRDHSALLRDRARRIGELRAHLQPTVMDESIWHGPDAAAFRADWSSRTAPLLDRIAGEVMRHGGDLEAHAEEQDRTSGAGTAGTSGGTGSRGAGSSGGSTDDGSQWETITGGLSSGLGVYNDLQGLWNNGKKIWDLTGIIRDSTRFIDDAENIVQFVGGHWLYDRAIADNIFHASQEFSGLAEAIAKQVGLPTGIGNTKFFGWMDGAARWADDAMPFLSNAAPFIGKALPAVDLFTGGLQMIEGIQSGDTFSAVTGGASALGGGLMLAGGALSATGVGAVIGGPLAAAGAIISGGAALADVGRTVYENWDSISATASDAWNATTDFVGDTAGAVTDTVGNVVDSVSDGISDAVDGLADALPW